MRDLTQHLTTRADDSRAPPVFSSSEEELRISADREQCQDLVRFFALRRIKPHTPLLVRAPVNSFEFHRCRRTPQVEYLTLSLYHSEVALRTVSIHRLLRGLPGYLILFDTHAFEPQRQSRVGMLPSQSEFCVISMHFTATQRIPHTSLEL